MSQISLIVFFAVALLAIELWPRNSLGVSAAHEVPHLQSSALMPADATSDELTRQRNMFSSIANLGDETELPSDPEQAKIDTIFRSLMHLPESELSRYDVSFSSSKRIEKSTPEAEKLLVAWEQRQHELREAMKQLLKPAEIMANLTARLSELSSQVTYSESEMVQTLATLQDLLTDVDNSRDFHNHIRGFPLLASLVSSSHLHQVRTMAAWTIGTAVENSVDYQSWLLEPLTIRHADRAQASDHVTCALELLLDLFLEDSEVSLEQWDGLKKGFFALSSALRQDVDNQLWLRSRPGSLSEWWERLVQYAKVGLEGSSTQDGSTSPEQLMRWDLSRRAVALAGDSLALTHSALVGYESLLLELHGNLANSSSDDPVAIRRDRDAFISAHSAVHSSLLGLWSMHSSSPASQATRSQAFSAVVSQLLDGAVEMGEDVDDVDPVGGVHSLQLRLWKECRGFLDELHRCSAAWDSLQGIESSLLRSYGL